MREKETFVGDIKSGIPKSLIGQLIIGLVLLAIASLVLLNDSLKGYIKSVLSQNPLEVALVIIILFVILFLSAVAANLLFVPPKRCEDHLQRLASESRNWKTEHTALINNTKLAEIESTVEEGSCIYIVAPYFKEENTRNFDKIISTNIKERKVKYYYLIQDNETQMDAFKAESKRWKLSADDEKNVTVLTKVITDMYLTTVLYKQSKYDPEQKNFEENIVVKLPADSYKKEVISYVLPAASGDRQIIDKYCKPL